MLCIIRTGPLALSSHVRSACRLKLMRSACQSSSIWSACPLKLMRSACRVKLVRSACRSSRTVALAIERRSCAAALTRAALCRPKKGLLYGRPRTTKGSSRGRVRGAEQPIYNPYTSTCSSTDARTRLGIIRSSDTLVSRGARRSAPREQVPNRLRTRDAHELSTN